MRLRTLRWGLPVLLAIAPAAAQNVRFNPSLALDQGYTDNVGYADTVDTSDSETRLQLDLPFERETRTSLLRFGFASSFTQYGDTEALDNDSHRLDMVYEREGSAGDELRLRVLADRTQTQGDPTSFDDSDLFLTRRTERDRVRADLRYRGLLGGRWGWGGSLGAGTTSFEQIEGFGVGAPLVEVEDRSQATAGLRLTRSVSRRGSLGMAYDHGYFDLDESGSERSHRLSFVGEYELSRTEELRFEVGGFRSEGDAAAGVGAADDSRTGFSTSLRYQREMKRADLGLVLERAPTSGGARAGTSTNTTAGILVNGRIRNAWRWNASARYAIRDPSDETQDSLDTVSLGARIERSVGRVFSVRTRTSYIRQSGGDDLTDDTSTYAVWVGFVWHPLGNTEFVR